MLLLQNILLWIASIALLVFVIVVNIKKLPDKPKDDSAWNIDKDALYNNLQRFISSKQEKICAVLNVQNALNLLQNGISEEGFAILTDKACYFVGKVYQKKWIFAFKANIQHRIVANEMKGVKVGSLSRFGMVIPSIISTMLTIREIKWIAYVFMHAEMCEEYEVVGDLCLYTIGLVLVMIFLSVYCFVQAFIVKRTNICIEFTSLTIAFLVSSLGAQEIKDFYKAVSKVQELSMTAIPVVNVAPMVNASSPRNKVESLSELSKLYEQGMVSEEEFNKLKSEIINNQ